MNRRFFLATAATGAAFAATAAFGQDKPQTPWEWTDENGLARFLKEDKAPLENEFEKYPRCAYCGMVRKEYSSTRQLIVYDDDKVDGTCSAHCSAISLSLNLDRGPKTIWVGNAGAAEDIKPLIDAATATFVIDPGKPGVMSPVSKLAYADKAAAEAALVQGARLASLDEVIQESYLEMAKATMMIRKRRAEKRAAKKM